MTPRTRQRHWDWRAAGNFTAGGAGSGLIVTSALAAQAGAAFRLPLLTGALLIAGGLSLVWLEIGRPWRALNVFFHPATSWMTREGLLALLVLPLALAGAATGAPGLALAAGLAAAGFLFCQAQILRAARGIPAWRQPELVPAILAAGLAEGSGLYLLAAPAGRVWLLLALAAGLVRAGAWWRYQQALAGAPGAGASRAAFGGLSGRLAWAAQAFSLGLLALALASAPATLGAAGGVFAALAGAGLKTLLITRAGFTRAVVLPAFPVRGGGGHAHPGR